MNLHCVKETFGSYSIAMVMLPIQKSEVICDPWFDLTYDLRSAHSDPRYTVRLCFEGVIKQTYETVTGSTGRSRVSTYMIQAVSCVASGMMELF
jgi:hypothetical protein